MTNKAHAERTSCRYKFFIKKTFWVLPYINGIQSGKAITGTYVLANNLLFVAGHYQLQNICST